MQVRDSFTCWPRPAPDGGGGYENQKNLTKIQKYPRKSEEEFR
jgi:hypothetical protein